jgi:methyltransferase
VSLLNHERVDKDMALFVIALLIFVPMLVEAVRAARNERAQKARGGIEPPHDVYNVMRVVYPAAFLAMLAEGAARGAAPAPIAVTGIAVFAAAKIIKWSAILALGRCWTFRVIVVPGDTLVGGGPYRYLRHPNYVGVLGELVGAALMTRALVGGPIAVIAFAALLSSRISVEERALRAARAAKITR